MKKLSRMERKQKELLELMALSMNSLYSLVSSRNRHLKPARKMQLYYETLAKLDREERWFSRKKEFRQLLRNR